MNTLPPDIVNTIIKSNIFVNKLPDVKLTMQFVDKRSRHIYACNVMLYLNKLKHINKYWNSIVNDFIVNNHIIEILQFKTFDFDVNDCSNKVLWILCTNIMDVQVSSKIKYFNTCVCVIPNNGTFNKNALITFVEQNKHINFVFSGDYWYISDMDDALKNSGINYKYDGFNDPNSNTYIPTINVRPVTIYSFENIDMKTEYSVFGDDCMYEYERRLVIRLIGLLKNTLITY